MNFLHLVPKWTYDTKMARERFRWMDYVHEQVLPYGHGVHTTGPGWSDWNENATMVQNLNLYQQSRHKEEQAHFIVAYDVEGIATDCPIPVCVVIQEAYNRPKTLKTIHDVDAKLVIFTYANEMPQYQAELEAEGRDVVAIPHSADDRCFKDYGEEKLIDVLIVGSMNQTIYPFRNRLARLAWRDLRKRGYRVEWLKHPGYTIPPKAGLIGEAYARKINQAKLVVTCTSRYRYALGKLCEIPLCRALPVSDLPADRQKFFSQTMLNVEPWMLDREILTKIEDVLDDEDDLAARIKLAHDKIEFRLVMKYWAERFIYWARRHTGEIDMAPPMPLIGDEDKE